LLLELVLLSQLDLIGDVDHFLINFFKASLGFIVQLPGSNFHEYLIKQFDGIKLVDDVIFLFLHDNFDVVQDKVLVFFYLVSYVEF
jgi:hypothetical protein